MAVQIARVRRELIIALYDLLQSSDEEGYWYSLSGVRELIDIEISGAMARIVIDELVQSKYIERGHDEGYNDIYALTAKGIKTAEDIISKKDAVSQHSVAPSRDLLYDPITDREKIEELSRAIRALKERFESSNAAGQLPQVERDVLANEIASADLIANSGVLRPKRLASFILPASKFLSDKFVGTALGEAAKHLIKLLLG